MLTLIIGPFLGVGLAFLSQRLYDWSRDRKNRKKLKENLKTELKTCIDRLTEKGNLLPTTMWNSTVTSGDVKLLSFDEKTHLSSIYFEIENHNYEAKRVRDSAVIARAGSRQSMRGGKTSTMAYWTGLEKALLEAEQSLKQRISELLKEPWW